MLVVSRFLILALAATQQPAQTAAAGTISGSVVDATTSAPLDRATVTLTSSDGFGLLRDAGGSTGAFALARTVTTSATGAYRFTELSIGAYRLRIQRVGYEPSTVDVRLGDAGTPSVSIGLVVLPVRLRAVEVRARDSSAPNTVSVMDDDARVAAARARQEAFLSTDARELTSADVAESATLGGSDVLRALQRLPGVTQLDDWSAELWVRGNRWDHNRVYFDGLPLFDPLGVLGRTSGVSADAIGGAFLHPGVRPVSLGGEGATRIDLQSRPAAGAGAWRGTAEVTQFGASGSVERARADTSAGFLVTAQHSLGSWLPRDGVFFDALAGRSFSDAQATARGDVDLGGGRRIETSGLFTRDARITPYIGVGDETTQEWSNVLGRVTLVAPLGSVTTSHSIGASHFGAHTNRQLDASPSPVESSVDYVTLGGRIAARAPQQHVTTAGYDVISEQSSIDGTQQSLAWFDPAQARASRRAALTYGSVWIDDRAPLGDRVTIENGFRLDVGGAHGLDAVRPAGSAQALFAISSSTRVSIGASRTHQYVQAIDLPVVGQGETLPTSWLTSGDDVPVMSVDNATAGVEKWIGTGNLVGMNAYVRHTTGAIAADPTPGPLVHRPLFVDASESARGVEVSARKLIGRATGLLAYSYGSATMHAGGLSFPAPADRTHALDAALSVHFASFNLGGSYALTSGAPYTRIVAVPPTGVSSATGLFPTERESPNAQRLPVYGSLDLLVTYARTMRAAKLVAFAGAQNVLGRKNVTWYEISGYCDNGQSQPTASAQCRDHDLVQAPVKLAPTLGLRLVVR